MTHGDGFPRFSARERAPQAMHRIGKRARRGSKAPGPQALVSRLYGSLSALLGINLHDRVLSTGKATIRGNRTARTMLRANSDLNWNRIGKDNP